MVSHRDPPNNHDNSKGQKGLEYPEEEVGNSRPGILNRVWLKNWDCFVLLFSCFVGSLVVGGWCILLNGSLEKLKET